MTQIDCPGSDKRCRGATQLFLLLHEHLIRIVVIATHACTSYNELLTRLFHFLPIQLRQVLRAASIH
jgi:hypothetical protein